MKVVIMDATLDYLIELGRDIEPILDLGVYKFIDREGIAYLLVDDDKKYSHLISTK